MITERKLETHRAGKVTRLEADNARLRKLAEELNAEVRELRAAVEMRHAPSTIDSARRLLVVSGGERRVRGA